MSATASPEPAQTLVTEGARPEHAEQLAALFERNATACHCQWWHFEGDKNAWLDRCAHSPSLNRLAFEAQLREPRDLPVGIVAKTPDAIVGWMKLSPAESLSKLYSQRVYKGLACFVGDRSGVIAIGCFLVDEAFRRRGVARRLLETGIQLAAQAGVRALEAFPRRTEFDAAAELWTGPPEVFLDAGFEVINDFRPYPVLRLLL